jgi:DNA-directed RNA polymerase specialized sigma24 family protein
MKRMRRISPIVIDEPYEMPDPIPAVIDALAKLTWKQRAALVLRYYADHSLGDIASMIGSTPGGVAVHLTRGRRRLRELSEEEDRDDTP